MEPAYIKKLAAGDPAALAYFLDTYRDMAFTIASRIVNNREDAEEVVQDAFVRACMAIGQFRQDAKFSTWFYRIVVNRALTKIKKTLMLTADTEVNELEDMASEDMESIYKRLGAAEQKKIIDSALQELVMEDRLLLTLYYLQEQSVEEIARVTGLVKENIKMRLHRARKKLYLVLQQQLKSEINCVL